MIGKRFSASIPTLPGSANGTPLGRQILLPLKKERGQVSGVDIYQFPGRTRPAIATRWKHGPAQSRIAFPQRMDSEQLDTLRAENPIERLQLVVGGESDNL